MLSHQEVELFEGIRRIKGCGLGGGVALLEEVWHWEWALGVSKAHARPSLSVYLFLFISVCRSGCGSQLLLQFHAPTMMIMD